MVTINGETKDVAGRTLRQFLMEEGYDISRIVVERNLQIVPKERFEEVMIEEGDSIEVLSFVGGG